MSYQAFPKSTGAIPDGYILTYSAADGYMKPSSLSRRVAIDSNTVINWIFDESAAPFANSGTGGSLNSSAGSGSVITSRQGIFNLAVSNGSGATNGLTSGNTSVGESNSITLSCWVYLRAYTNFADIVVKQYRNDGTWTAPFASVQLDQDNSGNGGLQFVVAIGGVARVVNSIPAADKLQLNKWYFLALTYDSTTGTLSGYINGDLIGTATGAAGNIDWGTHGAWCVLGNTATTSETTNGMVDDVRIENVVRSQAYLQTMYRAGAGLQNYGASLTITPNSSAGGDLAGSYPNPTVAALRGVSVNATSPTDGHVLMYDGVDGYWAPKSISTSSLQFAQPHDTSYSPIALYQLNGDLTDSSGNGRTLTLDAGTARYSDISPHLKGFAFDGASRLKSTDTIFRITGDITIEMLINIQSASAASIVAEMDTGETPGTNYNYAVSVVGTTGHYFESFWEFGSGTNVAYDNTSGSYVVGDVFHFAYVRASNVVTMYMNGKVWGAPSGTLTAPDTSSPTQNFYVGGNIVDPFFNGIISSLKVIGRALTATEVESEFERTLGNAYNKGILNAQTTQLSGYSVSTTAPTNGNVLTWSASNSNWTPQAPAISTTAASTVSTTETTTSVTYTDLATVGPSVTITTGTSVIIMFSSIIRNTISSGNTGWVSVGVSGATTLSASDTNAFDAASPGSGFNIAGSRVLLLTGLTPGSNTFTLKYRVDGSTWAFENRTIAVFAL